VQKLVSPANYFSFFFFVFAETYFWYPRLFSNPICSLLFLSSD
jgi:hypothetical protein